MLALKSALRVPGVVDAGPKLCVECQSTSCDFLGWFSEGTVQIGVEDGCGLLARPRYPLIHVPTDPAAEVCAQLGFPHHMHGLLFLVHNRLRDDHQALVGSSSSPWAFMPATTSCMTSWSCRCKQPTISFLSACYAANMRVRPGASSRGLAMAGGGPQLERMDRQTLRYHAKHEVKALLPSRREVFGARSRLVAANR